MSGGSEILSHIHKHQLDRKHQANCSDGPDLAPGNGERFSSRQHVGDGHNGAEYEPHPTYLHWRPVTQGDLYADVVPTPQDGQEKSEAARHKAGGPAYLT